ncbi:hypothetical protein [Shinella zoogloeoides]|uniref:Uncharacterized protein n=1 Tax=Shinella zoogloeoides TaxID=352475 RepID=A0A6N8TLE6_SHIZO|nr:hypothetical protein [Shinella zoogloeoides]MXO03086.1 hypothetical protein [Shinella zoogloeoides]
MGYADQLRAMIKELRERPEIFENPDADQLESNKQTVDLMLKALEAIAGRDYWKRVFDAAEMPNGVGDWEKSPRKTARAYKRILATMLETQDMGKIIGLLEIKVPIQ